MAIPQTQATGPGRQPPQADSRQSPINAQQNTAASKAPGETRRAVLNTFGGIPKPPTRNLVTTPPAVDENGKQIVTPDGYAVTHDKRGHPVAVDNNGQVLTDRYGNPLALTAKGNYVPGAVYDKTTGFRVTLDIRGMTRTSSDGRPFAIDDNGKFILTTSGASPQGAVYDSRGVPVFSQGRTPEGLAIYTDARTGEPEVMSDDVVYKYNPATSDIAKGEDGNFLPPLYSPVDSDPTRPPVRANQDAETTLKNLPQGKERGDPMAIKNELFDDFGNLDVDRLATASGRYDPRDVYDALINSGKSGGWDALQTKLPDGAALVHPNEDQSRRAIAALIAWQNENGKYNPLKQGKVPSVVFYSGGPDKLGGFADYAGKFGNVYINVDQDAGSIATSTFHELNHAGTSEAFKARYAYNEDVNSQRPVEVISEYLASNWSGNKADTGYETSNYRDDFARLEDAVRKLGDGDRDKGMDLLKRAYFAGDQIALRKLMEYFPPAH